MVPFPLETISAADVADVDIVDIVDIVVIVVVAAAGVPNNLKKLIAGSSVVGQDPHGSALI